MKIGLFGTCGKSTWRKSFIDIYESKNIDFFNPQLPDGMWTPDRSDEFVQIENSNLKSNDIILFPVTSETTGQGSLAEIGFSVCDAMRNLNNQYLIVLIDLNCLDEKATESQIEDSKRSRKLVRSKVEQEIKINPNVFLVDNMSEMKNLSLDLHQSITGFNNIREKYLKAI
jgi:hypothetical protein